MKSKSQIFETTSASPVMIEADAVLHLLQLKGHSPAVVLNIGGLLAAHALAQFREAQADEMLITLEQAVRENTAEFRASLYPEKQGK